MTLIKIWIAWGSGMILAEMDQVDPTENLQTQAYVFLVQGDYAQDTEKWESAIKHYQNALKQFRHVTKEHPNWQPDSVRYRTSYCANQIAEIKLKTDAKKDSKSQEESRSIHELEKASYQAKYESMLKENKYLRGRLDDPEIELTDKESDENRREKQDKKRQKEIKALKKEIAKLETGS